MLIAVTYIQISFFDDEIAREKEQKRIEFEKAMRCYRCLMFISHRCRNNKECPEGLHYEEYIGSLVRQCLCATVEIFQDGYIHCPILHSITCEECLKKFGDGTDFDFDESQNYERFPEWKQR